MSQVTARDKGCPSFKVCVVRISRQDGTVFQIELDDDAIDAINQAEAQLDRGEGEELDSFRERMRLRTNRG